LTQIKAPLGGRRIFSSKKEATMPLHDVIIIAAIVSAFTVFGVVLAWGERQTRNLDRKDAGARSEQLKKAA
jgi:multisubunit Na+/H+ antiporter MnhC subunit